MPDAEEVVKSILAGSTLCGGHQRYRNVSIRFPNGDYHKEVDHPVNFRRPAWPGGQTTQHYRDAAVKLFDLARAGELPFHVPANEVLKAIECRISEILYYVGFYPESWWVRTRNPLPFWKKVKLARLILPDNMFPITLVTQVQTMRNVVEHQFDEPDHLAVRAALETMHLFLSASSKVSALLSDVSLFEYRLNLTGAVWCVQIRRDKGQIVLFTRDYNPDDAATIDTEDHIVQEADYCTSLIGRILSDLHNFDGDSASFFRLDEVLPNTLGPDIAPEPEVL